MRLYADKKPTCPECAKALGPGDLAALWLRENGRVTAMHEGCARAAWTRDRGERSAALRLMEETK